MIKILSLLVIFFTSIVSFASDSTHGSHGVPWSALYPQFLNFSVVLGVLIYFSKTKLGDVFKVRQSQYTDLVTRAEKAKVEAEASKQKISERLSKLVKSANDDIEKARSEALQLKNQIIKDAETLSVRMAEEAKKASFFELERAKNEIREEILKSSIESARRALNEEVDSSKQKKLQDEFVEKVQAVR